MGRLNVTGSDVEAHSIFLGLVGTGDGTITVHYATLSSASMLAGGGYINEDGTASAPGGTGQLAVQNYGDVEVANTLIVFGDGTVNLTGDGGSINTGSFLNDEGGTFTHDDGTLTVDGGTFVPNAGGNYSIDGLDALKLPVVQLTGGANYTSNATLFVGHTYRGQLEISSGSTVNTLNGRVGWLAGDSSGSVFVGGNQSQWINSADLPALTGDLTWDIVYGSDFVRLDVRTPYSADFDGDGDVDANDLGKWQGDYGGPGSDADGDGDSDGADFLAWQQQHGSGVGPLASSSGIPEPSALALLLTTACGGLAVRRRIRD